MWLTVHLWIVQETIDLSCTIHQSVQETIDLSCTIHQSVQETINLPCAIHQSVQETIDLSCAVHQRCDIYSRNFESSCFIGGGSIFPMLIKSFSDIKNNFILPWMLNYALSINFLIQMIDIQLGTDHLTWMGGGYGFLFRSEKNFRTTQELEYLFFLSCKAQFFFSRI